MSNYEWWNNLRHNGLFLSLTEVSEIIDGGEPVEVKSYVLEKYQRQKAALESGRLKVNDFAAFVLESLCGFHVHWKRGTNIDASWSRRSFSGENTKPVHLYLVEDEGRCATLPVFFEPCKRKQYGLFRRKTSLVREWLRKGKERIAVLTNGFQWKLIYSSPDAAASIEWDIDQWTENTESLDGFRALCSPKMFTAADQQSPPPLLQRIWNSQKAQADLSAELGERVRQAVETLLQAYSQKLLEDKTKLNLKPQDIYLAAVRVVMRLVVILFAESRDGLLPKDNPLYTASYSLETLVNELKTGKEPATNRHYAWSRLLGLMRLIYHGSEHEKLEFPQLGGGLFMPGDAESFDPVLRAVSVLETVGGSAEMHDFRTWEMLKLLTETHVRIRQARTSIAVPMPVDFSRLDAEYIGILYEGLLDFDLRCAGEGSPIVFLNIGNQPALPVDTLEKMNDKELKDLIGKLQKEAMSPSSEDADEDAENDIDVSDEICPVEDDELKSAVNDSEPRTYTIARRIVELQKIVKKPKDKSQRETFRYEHETKTAAERLIARLVYPGEWYLVRWNGSRKGSGTFYTRPKLAMPTARRTLQPLVSGETSSGDDRVAPPEQILSLKICDPACGSGAFPLAALRLCTDALYDSLHYYNRIKEWEGHAILELIYSPDGKELLVREKLPCKRSDAEFEARCKAVLRRYIVERCIYGVDINPLAVELCKISLWLETLDNRLPLSFLDHKIKTGNALVGAWFDQYQHYPLAAWLREGGDKDHTNGVQYNKDTVSKMIKRKADEAKQEMFECLVGTLFDTQKIGSGLSKHRHLETMFEKIHNTKIHETAEQQKLYEELLRSADYQQLKNEMDLWCALWFWDGNDIENAVMPKDFYSADGLKSVANIAEKYRFFHWELEFPDVFNEHRSGFDAVLGNPPWDVAKPNSKEFFSQFDLLYTTYGKQDAIVKQKEYFTENGEIETAWLAEKARFKAFSNWMSNVAAPFLLTERRFANAALQWEKERGKSVGYADVSHPFRHQGGGDVNLYKAFCELDWAILRFSPGTNGAGDTPRAGFGIIVPSNIYSDLGSLALRQLFLSQGQWEWIFSFENRNKIFAIDSRFKFNPIIVRKTPFRPGTNGAGAEIQTAFMRRNLDDWEDAEKFVYPYPLSQIGKFSPKSRVLLEIQSERDLAVLEKIYQNAVMLDDKSWGIKYSTEFHMTNDSALFPPLPLWEQWGYKPDQYNRWLKGNWQPVNHPDGLKSAANGIILSRDKKSFIRWDDIDTVTFTEANGKPLTLKTGTGKNAVSNEITGKAIALPLYEGRMVGHYDYAKKGWVKGKGRTAVWREIPWNEKQTEPQFMMGKAVAESSMQSGFKLPIMNLGSATNARTIIGTVIPNYPCNHSINAIHCGGTINQLLVLSALINSPIFDFVVRLKLTGLNISFFVLDETPLPSLDSLHSTLSVLHSLVLRLSCCSEMFAPLWLAGGERGISWRQLWAVTAHERARLTAMCNALAFAAYGLDLDDVKWILRDCGHNEVPRQNEFDPKGFWRVDRDLPPHCRSTVLAQRCFEDVSGGTCAVDDWQLPDEAAKFFGAKFYDWQLSQDAAESWKECEIHAENLMLGVEKPVKTDILF